MGREQLEVRSGANPRATLQVTGRTMPPSSNIPRVEPSIISRVALQVELPTAPKLATPAKSLAMRSILPQVKTPDVSQVKRSSELWSIEPWPLASPRVDSQATLQTGSVPILQVQASSSAPLQPTTSSVSEIGSQATSIVDSLSRSESFKTSRSPSATTSESGAQSPTLSSISRATSPTVIQDQTLMSELGSSVGSDQDVRTKSLSLKRKREPSDLGQRSRAPKKPTLFKYWCQGCGLSFSQGGNAIEHKANPKSSIECRESELVFATNHPLPTKISADPEQNTGASRVTGRSQRNRAPFEDRDLQRAMRNEDVLRWCNSIKQ
ncbi:unnamed protein product [Rhizoctonia solani]|uniref:Uncharacterized protein n=1 Tax=Rhizoctonia solani TaxID=456999 RepID=A0A8H3HIG2_9AGAM|nr:unnamed protein product [Rhizoctonia solani]